MPTQLSQEDVQRLLAEPSATVRAEIADKLAHDLTDDHLTDKELAMAQDIVRVMAKDVSVIVRKSLAQNLRSATRLPHEVALQLANDVEEVALPIIEFSSVLTESDLVSIVRAGNAAKQEKIAGRADVSENVAEALITTGGEQAVSKLMQNDKAQIAENSMAQALKRFDQSVAVTTAMVQREKLPIDVAERLVMVVSEKLRDHLLTHHEISPTMAADIVMNSRERATVGLASGASEQDLERMILQMFKNKRLTPSLVLRAICMGDVGFFEIAVAVMANVPLVNARILIHDAGRLGLKSLYEKAGLPLKMLPAVRIALDVVRETELDGGEMDMMRYRARVIERVLTQCEDLAQEDLDYLLAKLNDYIPALNSAVA